MFLKHKIFGDLGTVTGGFGLVLLSKGFPEAQHRQRLSKSIPEAQHIQGCPRAFLKFSIDKVA
jgi:hypothetical protein